MTDQTENQAPSAADDIKFVMESSLMQQVQALFKFTRTEAFALQIPDTETLVLAGPRARIEHFLNLPPVDPSSTEGCAQREDKEGAPLTVPAPLTDVEIIDAASNLYLSDFGGKGTQAYDIAIARAVLAAQAKKAQAAPAPQQSESIDTPEFQAHEIAYTRALGAGDYGRAIEARHALISYIDSRASLAPVSARPELTVWYGPMPESSGAQNFTAILTRKDAKGFDLFTDGFTFERSEYPDRVRYEADFMRWLIGERTERPEMWDKGYDFDKHSGYVAPVSAQQGAAEKPFAGPGAWFSIDILGNPMREYAPGKWENCEWPSSRAAKAPAAQAVDATVIWPSEKFVHERIATLMAEIGMADDSPLWKAFSQFEADLRSRVSAAVEFTNDGREPDWAAYAAAEAASPASTPEAVVGMAKQDQERRK